MAKQNINLPGHQEEQYNKPSLPNTKFQPLNAHDQTQNSNPQVPPPKKMNPHENDPGM